MHFNELLTVAVAGGTTLAGVNKLLNVVGQISTAFMKSKGWTKTAERNPNNEASTQMKDFIRISKENMSHQATTHEALNEHMKNQTVAMNHIEVSISKLVDMAASNNEKFHDMDRSIRDLRDLQVESMAYQKAKSGG